MGSPATTDPGASSAAPVGSSELGHLTIASVRSGAQDCHRIPGLARRDASASLQVGLLTRGAATLVQDGRVAALRPGDFAVYETERPFVWALQGGWELLVLGWPRAGVALDRATSQQLTARALGGVGLGAIVGRMLRDLVADPPLLSPAGGVRLADELAELVLLVAAERIRPAAPARASDGLLRRIDAHILEHLADPGLTPTSIAAAHYVSTRHLHRLFTQRGSTVASHVQRLRLERCRHEMLDPGAPRSITDIARRWGFPDLPTFSRAFRCAYGMAPSTWRACRRPGAERPDD